MATIQCRLEYNPLKVPLSLKLRYVPRGSIGTDGIAAAMSEENPNYTEEAAKTMIATLVRVIKKKLLEGIQPTIDGAWTFDLSFPGNFDSTNIDLTSLNAILHANIHILQPLLKEIKNDAHFSMLDMIEKVPVINSTEDTRLHLANVLYSKGVLHLTGTNLLFNPETAGNECVLAGVQSGRQVQTQFGPISDTSIVFVPDIPAQAELWQNEYILSLSTRYTAHGTPRTGTYRLRLRSVLVIERLAYETGPGILSDSSAATPCVSFESATATGPEMLRIQTVFDVRNNWLLFNLISMKEDGPVGAAVTVTANSAVTLPGFAGSAISSMTIVVHDYAALLDLMREHYYGRLVDVLDLKAVV